MKGRLEAEVYYRRVDAFIGHGPNTRSPDSSSDPAADHNVTRAKDIGPLWTSVSSSVNWLRSYFSYIERFERTPITKPISFLVLSNPNVSVDRARLIFRLFFYIIV